MSAEGSRCILVTCMYTCILATCMYTCILVTVTCMYTCIRTYRNVRLPSGLSLQSCIPLSLRCVCVDMQMYIYASVPQNVHICIYIHIYTYMHVYIHVYAHPDEFCCGWGWTGEDIFIYSICRVRECVWVVYWTLPVHGSAYIYIHVYTSIHVFTSMYTNVRRYACMIYCICRERERVGCLLVPVKYICIYIHAYIHI